MVETVLDQSVHIPMLRVDDVDIVEDRWMIFDQLIVLLVQQNQHSNVLFHIPRRNKPDVSLSLPFSIRNEVSTFSFSPDKETTNAGNALPDDSKWTKKSRGRG